MLTIESLIRTKRIALLLEAITVTWIQLKYNNKERQVNLEIYGNQALPSRFEHTPRKQASAVKRLEEIPAESFFYPSIPSPGDGDNLIPTLLHNFASQ